MVAQGLRLRLGGADITAKSIARAIGEKHLLLVLDNCEHVIDAAAGLAEMLVRLCPRVTILATSREVLRIHGESVYRVPPLEVPAEEQAGSDELLGYSAAELFISRAEEMNSDFAPDAQGLRTIAEICRHLDGIPLAIEFAAARAVTLGIQQVAAGLSDRFALLTSGRRTAVPRHRTLRATLDWSYELLPESERRLLRRLSVFAGGFDLDAAVAADADRAAAHVVGDIGNLVAKSLVMRDMSASQGRWKLLETIRDHAARKLAESGESDDARRRHAAFLRGRFAPSESGFSARLSRQDLIRNGQEIDNVRAALDWSFSPAGDTTIGVALTAAYAPVWLDLSLVSECHERCERALNGFVTDTEAGARLRMQLRIGMGTAMSPRGSAALARAVLTEALETARSLNDLDAQARALWALTDLNVGRGAYDLVRIAAEELREIADRGGDPAVAFVADRFMGDALLAFGRAGEARVCYERALRSPAMPDDQPLAIWFHPGEHATVRAQLARALWVLGFLDQALTQAKAGLEHIEGTDHLLWYCRVLYFGLCRVALMRGDLDEADRAIAHMMEAATTANAVFWKTFGRFLEGKLLVERGAFAEAAAALEASFETCQRMGWRASRPEFMGALAMALVGLGRPEEARAAMEDAIVGAGQREDGQEWYTPELLRMNGEVLLVLDTERNVTEAEECFERAARMARQQGALFWELRIALSLARLRATQGRGGEARRILRPIYDRFSEGFETADLTAARAILDAPPS
jgi:predicted ATPase